MSPPQDVQFNAQNMIDLGDLNYGTDIIILSTNSEQRVLSKTSYKSELEYSLWLIKCYIMTDNADEAWECYLQTEDEHISSEILQLIGNDCYKLGGDMFLFSARAFHELLKMDSYQDYTDGLIGSSVGVLKNNLISGENESNSLVEVMNMLEDQSQQKCHDVASSIQKYIDGKCYLEY